jgi:hypothetical protein
MPFPKSLAIFNKYVTNRIFLTFAGRMAFPTDSGFVFALTYGKDVDWVKNLVTLNRGFLEFKGSKNLIHSFSFTDYEEVKELFPILVRIFFMALSVNDCLITKKQD